MRPLVGRGWRTSLRPLSLLLLLVCALRADGQGLGIDELLRAPAAPDPSSLGEMLERLDALAVEFENAKDVKCWTSFGQLETFVAGSDFTPEATHHKTEVVLGILDQLWRAAVQEAKQSGPVSEATLDLVVERILPARTDDLSRIQVALGDRIVEIPAQDVRDYEGTVEPIRLLRTVTERAARSDPTRPPLSSRAIERARPLAARVATVVLKESSAEARRHRHERVETSDVIAADRRIAAAVGLEAHDPAKTASAVAPSAGDPDAHAAMREVVRGKIRSLDVFNTEYSKEKLGQVFDANLARRERQWAKRAVAEAASQHYKHEALVDLAARLYRKAAEEHPKSDPLRGSEMLESISGLYPRVTEYFGVTMLFPITNEEKSFWVPEHIADAFRDSGWHWKALDLAIDRLGGAESGLPVLDLYAMEELTEFVSIFAVALVQTAGELSRRAGEKEVDVAAVDRALEFFETHRMAELASPDSAPAVDAEEWERAAEVARRGLAGAFVAEPFTDVTEQSGVAFLHEDSQMVLKKRFPAAQKRTLRDGREIMVPRVPEPGGLFSPHTPVVELGLAGGGVAAADVDGDGLLDLYLVSGTLDRLYRNLGNLRFEDVTAASGLDNREQGRGAYFVDYDNDGDPDLFLTQDWAPNRLFQNAGDGTFQDVTEAAGFPMELGTDSHSATWFDFDNDGHLDVYVGNFGDWLRDARPFMHHSRNGQANQLFRNRGDGTFEDISERAYAGSTGWVHAVSHFDANNDGWQDLYIANDFGSDELLLNIKGERFFDITPDELRQRSLHGMSVGFTDANADGIEDVYVSNIALFSFVSKYIQPGEDTELVLTRRTVENARMVENNVLLVSGDGTFVERQHDYFDRSARGDGWAWDADFFDFDNDGFEDLYVVNGREPNLPYDRERNVLYRQSEGRFFDVSGESGADIAANSRGAVAADLDADGDLDLVVNNYLDRAVVLRNNLRRNHWVKLRLEGRRSNRDGVGARVELTTPAGTQRRTVRGGSGYLSHEPLTLSFGIGDAERVERVEIVWPSGIRQSVEGLPANRLHRIVEAETEEGVAARP